MKNGLKGVTDATTFCKSMKKGGTAPMIRSMKSYDEGGSTTEAMCPPGKKGCHSRSKSRSKGKSSETRGGLLSGIGTGIAALLAYKGYKNMKDKE